MADIFMSYASDDRSRAEPIAKALEEQGWSVWWDRKIPPGKTFSQVIEEAINAAKCIIVLWSNESVKSDWVQNEAAEGARRKILVPALIDIVQIPFEFRRIQAADLTDWKTGSNHPGFIILLSAISEIVGPSQLKVQDTEKKLEEDERKRKHEQERKPKKEEQKPEEVKGKVDRKKGMSFSGELFSRYGVYLIAAAIALVIIAVALLYYKTNSGEKEKPSGTELIEKAPKANLTFKEWWEEKQRQ